MRRIEQRWHYAGGKGRSYRDLINLMPPHVRYVETHLGAGAILRNKRPARSNIGIELDREVVAFWERKALPGVDVLQGDCLEVLPRLALDHGDLVYSDPPYLAATRRHSRALYAHDYEVDDHERLLTLLKTLSCKVIISGYATPLYDELLSGWTRRSYPATTHKGVVVECAWMNFEPSLPLHDYAYCGAGYRERERLRRRAASLADRIGRASEIELFAALAHLADRHPDAIAAAAARLAP